MSRNCWLIVCWSLELFEFRVFCAIRIIYSRVRASRERSVKVERILNVPESRTGYWRSIIYATFPLASCSWGCGRIFCETFKSIVSWGRVVPKSPNDGTHFSFFEASYEMLLVQWSMAKQIVHKIACLMLLRQYSNKASNVEFFRSYIFISIDKSPAIDLFGLCFLSLLVMLG